MILAIIATTCLVITTVVNAVVKVAELRKLNAERRKIEAETPELTG